MNEFGVGRVLGMGFKIWARNLIPFTVLAVLIYSPMVIWSAMLASNPLAHIDSLLHWDLYLGLFSFASNVAIAAVLTYGVVMELQGSHASMGACVAKGISRLLPVIGVVLLSTLAIVAGMIALVVPGIIISLMLYVATPVAVIEKTGVVASMKRSRELTFGHKGSIFVIVFVLGILGYVVRQVETQTLVPHDPAKALAALPMLIYVELGTVIVLGALGAVMSAVAYYFLRLSKEGTSAQELASVFE
jgi:hypothetical protein